MSDDELVKRYLLGDLPGNETEALERRLLTEDDLFELAEALEAEVLEDHAEGGLTPAQQERVERYLAVSPEGRLRLAVVRGLATLPAAQTVWRKGKLLPFTRPAADEQPEIRIAAIAAMLAMVIGAVWLALQIQVPPSKIVNKIPPVLETPAGRVEPRVPALPDLVAGTPPQPAPPSPSPPPVATPTPSPVVFAATLALLSQRGAEEIPTFDIPADTDVFELRLTLQAGDEGYPSYRVILNDGTGEVTESEGLHADRSSRQLTLRVDGDRLAAGRYSLRVQGVTSEGNAENISFSEFEVRQP